MRARNFITTRLFSSSVSLYSSSRPLYFFITAPVFSARHRIEVIPYLMHPRLMHPLWARFHSEAAAAG
jgi:hypothetical protein